MDVVAAASPRLAVPSSKEQTDKHEQLGMQAILKMHELGIFTKDEVRQLVFKRLQMSSDNKCATIQSKRLQMSDDKCATIQSKRLQMSDDKCSTIQRKRLQMSDNNCATIQSKRFQMSDNKCATVQSKVQKDLETKPVHNSSALPLQKRKATDTTTSELRKIAKNTVRQRFFNECLKKASPLWHETSGGKQAMSRLLFERAASDVLNKLYAENPGPLRAVKSQELKQIVHWQVMRDRNNWMGKQPKRASFFGTMATFDFEKEKIFIDNALSAATDLTKKESAPVKVEHKCEVRTVKVEHKCEVRAAFTPPPKPKLGAARARVAAATPSDADSVTPLISNAMKNCFTCGVDVWIDKMEDCPPATELAFPVGSSWGAYNVEPYCKKCWQEENTFLQNLGLQYKAVGKAVGSKRKPATLITEPDHFIHKIVSKSNHDAIVEATSMNQATPPPRKKKTVIKKATKQKTTGKKATGKKATKQTTANKPKKKMKKKLGGWRGPLLKENVHRWEVCTACRAHNLLSNTILLS